ncbi:MAG: Ig-like domain-containing protein [Gemmatimonadaceae bacterium]|nr:Ig-like domain-containing protein [Gemmatimonadaceae bacterium]
MPTRTGWLADTARCGLPATLLVVALGCGDASTESSRVASITVSPSVVSLRPGEARTIEATVVDAAGSVVRDRTIFWSSRHPSIVTVTASGIVTAVSAGVTEVAASAGGHSAVVPVTITALPASLVRVLPGTSTIRVGTSVSLAAEAFNAAGDTIADAVFAWTSSNAAVATVSGAGMVTGVGTGTVSISAQVDGAVGSALVSVQRAPVASVTVAPDLAALLVGQSVQLNAEARDATGNVLAGRVVTWSSNAPTVLSVSSTGVVTALGVGSARITATAEGERGTARVTSSAVPVASVSVFPNSATLAVGRTASMIAVVRDSAGTVLGGRAVNWSSDAPTIATVDDEGTVSAVTVGQATIRASAGGKSGHGVVTVVPVPVASVTLTPTTASVRTGDSLQLVATARDAAGNVLPARTINYTSGAPSIAAVGVGGVVTGIGAGTAVIVATSEGKRATSTLTIMPIPVAAVRVSPSAATLAPGDTIRLSVVMEDDRGTPLPGRVATWTSLTPAIATVSAAGLVTALTAGTATIRATSDGVHGDAAVSVVPPVVSTTVSAVRIAALGGTIHLGTLYARSVSAQALDASGAPIPGAQLSWSTSDPTLLTVTPGKMPGSATIVAAGTPTSGLRLAASSGGGLAAVTDTLTIDSDLVPIASVLISPSQAATVVLQGVSLTGTPVDSAGNAIGTAQGNPLGARSVAWSVNSILGVLTPTSGPTTTLTPITTGTHVVTGAIGGLAGTSTVAVSLMAVDTVESVPPSPAPTLKVAAGGGNTVNGKFRALGANGRPAAGVPFTLVSSDTTIATVVPVGSKRTDAFGGGEFEVTLTKVGVAGTSFTVTVTAGGKSTVYIINIA